MIYDSHGYFNRWFIPGLFIFERQRGSLETILCHTTKKSGNKRLFISPSSHLFYKKSDFELFKAFHLLTVTFANAQPKPQENLSITKVNSLTWGPCRTRLRPKIQKNSQKVAGGCPPTASPTQKLKRPFYFEKSRVYEPFGYHFEWFSMLILLGYLDLSKIHLDRKS